MKKFIFLFFLILSSGAMVMAQETGSNSGFFEDEYIDEGQDLPEVKEKGQRLKPYWNLSLGSSFSHVSGMGNFTGFYAAPTLSFPVNTRLSLHGGVIASFNHQPGSIFAGENNTLQNFTSFSLYGSATYRLTENLTLYGSGVKTLKTFPAPPPFMPFYPADNFTIGSSLKLGDHVTIGASFSKSDSYRPFGPAFGNPYGPSDMFW